jgi:hypothetical protein
MAMRLAKLRNGHTWRTKLRLALAPFVYGFKPPDVVRTLSYRPDFFGDAFSGLVHSALRGESPWTVAERELFAGFVSARNQCVF